jgi:nitroimidazol reductase NimA-like FMN-containing flavoprotein (pyridoxamine 5'-phosphate oxidase superfamily)
MLREVCPRPDDEPAGMADDRTTVTRLPDRARYDAETIASILDSAFVCQIGFVVEDEPVVLPTIYARIGDTAYIHGSTLSRWLSNIDGTSVCLSVTVTDGIVFARSAFHHSLNYRSVVAFGRAHTVTDSQERLKALKAVAEAVQPGRWDDSRQPNESELRATTVLRVPLDRASAKIRTGPPGDASADYESSYWAGVVPLTLQRGVPISDPKLRDGIPIPAYLSTGER